MVETQTYAIDKLELFSDCTRAELRQINSLTTRLDVSEGAVLMRQGDAPREFLIIGSGRAEVTRDTDAGATTVSELGSGQMVGEMALLMGTHRTATVTAVTDLTLFVSSVPEFRSILRIAPSVADKVRQTVEARAQGLAVAA